MDEAARENAQRLNELLRDPVKGPIVEQALRKAMKPLLTFSKKHLTPRPLFKAHTVRGSRS